MSEPNILNELEGLMVEELGRLGDADLRLAVMTGLQALAQEDRLRVLVAAVKAGRRAPR